MKQPLLNTIVLECLLVAVSLSMELHGQHEGGISLDSVDLFPKDSSFSQAATRQLNGHLEFSGYYSDQPILTEALATSSGWNYRIAAANEFGIGGLPVGLHYTYSNNPISAGLENGLSVDFSYERYKEKLLQKIKSRAEARLKELRQGDVDPGKVRGRLNRYEKLFESREFDKDMLDTERVDSLRQAVRPKELDSLKRKVSKYEKKVAEAKEAGSNRVREYEAKKEALEAKITDLEQLKSYIKKAEQVQQLHTRYRKLKGRYSNTDSLAGQKLRYYRQIADQRAEDVGISQLQGQLKEFGLYRKADRYLKYLREFKAGRIEPNWSEYSISTLPVKGVQTGFQGKNSSIRVVYGNGFDVNFFNIYQTLSDSTNQGSIVSKYDVLAVEGKYGSDRNSVTLRYQDIRPDREEAAVTNEPPQNTFERNRVVSMGFQIIPFEEYLKLKGEAALSLTTPASVAANNRGGNSYQIAKELFGKKAAQRGVSDLAYRIDASGAFVDQKLRYSLGYARVGQSFQSKGNPYLVNGTNEWEGRIGAHLLKRKLTVQFFTKQEYLHNEWYGHDPVEMTRYGATVRYQPRKWPYIMVTYYPYSQTIKDNSMEFQGLTATMGYTKRFMKLATNTTVSYSANQSSYEPFADTAILTTGNVLNFTETITFNNGLKLTTNGSWQQYEDGDAYSLRLRGGADVLKMGRLKAEIAHYWDHPTREGLGYSLTARARLTDWVNLDFRGERVRSAFYNNEYINRLTVSASVQW